MTKVETFTLDDALKLYDWMAERCSMDRHREIIAQSFHTFFRYTDKEDMRRAMRGFAALPAPRPAMGPVWFGQIVSLIKGDAALGRAPMSPEAAAHHVAANINVARARRKRDESARDHSGGKENADT